MPHQSHHSDSKAVDVGMLFAALAVSAAMFFLSAAFVYLLWNAAVVPVISSTRKASYWQAAGLLLLASLLFGGYHARPLLRQCCRK